MDGSRLRAAATAATAIMHVAAVACAHTVLAERMLYRSQKLLQLALES
jgi:pentatricopeptide repeat protein